MRVASKGTSLYVDLRGDTAGKAVLLFLHGGPGQGFDGLITVEAYTGPFLEPKYVVAYLHQRGVLRSPTVPDSTQTVETHVADVDNTIAALKQRFPAC